MSLGVDDQGPCPVRRFTDRDGEAFSVVPLTKRLASTHADFLVDVHNSIPFQYWTVDDLLSDNDATRTFHGKWELSTLAVARDETPMGFCIGFEIPPDGVHYPRPGVYMHRMSLAPAYRQRGVGAILHSETLWRALQRGLRIVQTQGTPPVIYGQTNKDGGNERIIAFHRDAGFRTIGRKQYPDRSDVVMIMTREDFLRSRHARLWHAHAVDRDGLPDLDGEIAPAPDGEVAANEAAQDDADGA
ncbi:GNAT family N-acetyltransferase [Verrucomicrobiota bacterium]